MRRLRLPRPRMRGVKISGSVILTKVGSIHNTSWMLAFELQEESFGKGSGYIRKKDGIWSQYNDGVSCISKTKSGENYGNFTLKFADNFTCDDLLGKESRLVTSPGLPRCCVDREILQGLRVPRWCSPLPHSDTPFPCHCQGSDCARCGMDKYGGNQGSKQMTGVPLAESKEQQFNSDLCRNLGIKIDKKAMGEIVSSLKH
ncbi:hypothetical protein MUK42_10862 [Musa troglodytarum]|uniref:Uncharacterized protein n=1 Tax=Musa troglodytarum TaxID=320322 RepID=A0A9E7F7U6_9LILI|nr:hypothetical protein MUK42_10862 [Musa troglodytarum]